MHATAGLAVYLSGRSDLPEGGASTRWRRSRVDANVVCLGLTSMMTDISSEMVTAVLPIYLMLVVRFTALQFGLLDAVCQGVTVALRLWCGWAADRRQRHKEVAAAGYALSAACKLGLFLSGGSPLPVIGSMLADRVGKGIRTAPRDALISLSSPDGARAEAFGVHRALDTAGALLGPIAAFALLAATADRFDAVFLTSACVAVVGLGILALFVENRPARDAQEAGGHAGVARTSRAVLAVRGFRSILLVGAAASVVTVSDAFIYLSLQRRTELDLRLFPLLYVGTALSYLLLAVPLGRLADRVGRGRVFIGGHVLLLGVYGATVAPGLGLAGVLACVALHGAYYAATDGVLMALASAHLRPGHVATGFALLTTATAAGRMLAAALYGAVWSWQGPAVAAALFGAGLVVAIVLAGAVLPGRRPGRA